MRLRRERGVGTPTDARAQSGRVSGLLVSEIVLRLIRPVLRGGLFVRYDLAALALCLDRLIVGASIPLGTLLDGSVANGGILVAGALGAVFELVFALVEGLIFAFTLVAAPWLFEGQRSLALADQRPQHHFDSLGPLHDEIGLGNDLWRPFLALYPDPQYLRELAFFA